jgi:hypothetical protein
VSDFGQRPNISAETSLDDAPALCFRYLLPSLLREGSRMLGGYKKLREIVGMSEIICNFAAVKVKRYDYGSNDNDLYRRAVGKTRAVRRDAPCC